MSCHTTSLFCLYLLTTNQSFQMRYCMTLYLKGHQKYDRSKLKVQLLLSKFKLFNFDLSYLLYPLRYKVTQYLIRKLSDMVKMICGSTFSICQDVLNSANLLYKLGFADSQMADIVYWYVWKRNLKMRWSKSFILSQIHINACILSISYFIPTVIRKWCKFDR